jgi:hypothetical protein
MTMVLLWLSLGYIPMMPGARHSVHVPSYGSKAPKCTVIGKAKSKDGLLKFKVESCR